MPNKPKTTGSLSSVQVQVQVNIEASPVRVWEAFVNEIDSWWLPDFYVTPEPHEIKIELWPGGRIFETGPDSSGLLWGTILHIVPDKELTIGSYIAPPWGGPANTFLRMQLQETDGGTSLTFTDSMFGVVNAESGQQIETSWQRLLEEGLKAYVERVKS